MVVDPILRRNRQQRPGWEFACEHGSVVVRRSGYHRIDTENLWHNQNGVIRAAVLKGEDHDLVNTRSDGNALAESYSDSDRTDFRILGHDVSDGVELSGVVKSVGLVSIEENGVASTEELTM